MLTTLLLLTACSSTITYSVPDDGPSGAPPPSADDTGLPDGDDTAGGDTSAGDDTAGDTSTDTSADSAADTSGDTSGDTAVDTSVDTGTPPTCTVGPYTGTYSVGSTTVALGVGVHPWHVHVDDFDGDGRTDLAYSWNVATFGGDELHIAVMFQDATGALGSTVSLATGHKTAFAGSFRTGDLNGDGLADLAAGTDDGVVLFFSDGAGGFTGPTELLAGDASSVQLGDVDGDGAVDIVSVGTDGLVQVWTGDGVGGFSAGWSGYTVSASIGEATALVDFDGDGNLDLALGDADGMALLFRGLVNDGSGTFDVASPVTPSVDRPMVTGMVGADLDGDGVDEVVTAGMLDRSYRMFVGGFRYDAGAFSSYYDLATPTGSAVTSLSVGDLDGDGLADLFASNALYMRGQLLFQRGPGAWEHVEVDLGLWYQSDVFPDASAVGDLNGDGCGDLVWRTDLDVVVAAGSGC